jgi:hypothetical protein
MQLKNIKTKSLRLEVEEQVSESAVHAALSNLPDSSPGAAAALPMLCYKPCTLSPFLLGPAVTFYYHVANHGKRAFLAWFVICSAQMAAHPHRMRMTRSYASLP